MIAFNGCKMIYSTVVILGSRESLVKQKITTKPAALKRKVTLTRDTFRFTLTFSRLSLSSI